MRTGTESMSPLYPVPIAAIAWLMCAALAGRRRSFRGDAQMLTARIRPAILVEGIEYLTGAGPHLLTVNHYSRPGLGVWWPALGISAAAPVELHWLMTAAWTFPDFWRDRFLRPMTRWAFKRVADVYGFTTTPPMPPDPRETIERGLAVRRLVNFLRSHPDAWLAFAPEGHDHPGARLGQPPRGVGRLVQLLSRFGLAIVPIGAYEQGGALCLKFGPAYRLDYDEQADEDRMDALILQQVMSRIANLLPIELRGMYT